MLAVIWFAGMNFADHRGKAYLYMHVTSLIRLPRCSMLNTHSVDTYLENTYFAAVNPYRGIPTCYFYNNPAIFAVFLSLII